jgi:RNA polymerase sigma-70 factor (ECF subfamily)
MKPTGVSPGDNCLQFFYIAATSVNARRDHTLQKASNVKRFSKAGGTMLQTQVLAATPNDADLDLVHASKKGDLTAFEELVKRYDRRLLRIAQNVVHDFNDAQEVVQEAFFKAYQRLDQFRENARFSTWLVRITLNECFMKVRKQRVTKEVRAEDVAFDMESAPSNMTSWVPNPETVYSRAELRAILEKALEELSPCSRLVFVLRDVDEFSINETAEALRLTPNAVRTRLSRARQQLREKLSRYFAKPKRRRLAASNATSAAKRMSAHRPAIAL